MREMTKNALTEERRTRNRIVRQMNPPIRSSSVHKFMNFDNTRSAGTIKSSKKENGRRLSSRIASAEKLAKPAQPRESFHETHQRLIALGLFKQ